VTGIGWVPLEGLGRRAGYITPYILFNVGYPDSNAAKPRAGPNELSLKKNKARITWLAN